VPCARHPAELLKKPAAGWRFGFRTLFYKHGYRNSVIWNIMMESGVNSLENEYGKTDGPM
jgi:hypothetical protein